MARMNLGLGMRVARLFWEPKTATNLVWNQILSTKKRKSLTTFTTKYKNLKKQKRSAASNTRPPDCQSSPLPTVLNRHIG
ncbi:hypothetical protein L596_000016 [Steinernema carpocapsae]|uniref:Uncharacterized protein n=1 Tax=Steinernema carpocapsae TaxID=34508 RepID=A0A4U8UHK0_STECR|nr:hypothetical protein L596_000010 [Steinernema carpocapsae]TMS32128.1 hypothetical protein L596_000013 [Steinernema carpocapsae]TMS32131.1 hypothetical protein L596_000016 [Steinernema carpocapsae]